MTFVLRQSFRRAALASLVATTALVASLPAWAVEPTGNEIADAFLASIEASGATELTVETVSGDDDTTEIQKLKAIIKDGTDSAELTIENVVIDEADIVDGRIEAGSFEVTGVTVTSADGKFTAGKASVENVVLPSAKDVGAGPEAVMSSSTYESGTIEAIVFADKDGFVLPIETVEFAGEDFVDGIARKGSLTAKGIVIDVASLPDDADGKPEMQRLGYDKITLAFALAGEWDEASATGKLEKLELSGDDVGTLSISATLGGLTKEVMEKLQKNENREESTQLLQGLLIQDISIDFKDASVTGRLLDAQAKESGTTAAVLADQLASALPAMLSMLQNPTFEKSVADAAGTFLKSPGSITATAKPAQPVPIAMIVGTAMMAPQTLPNVLNVEVVSTGK